MKSGSENRVDLRKWNEDSRNFTWNKMGLLKGKVKVRYLFWQRSFHMDIEQIPLSWIIFQLKSVNFRLEIYFSIPVINWTLLIIMSKHSFSNLINTIRKKVETLKMIETRIFLLRAICNCYDYGIPVGIKENWSFGTHFSMTLK